tara:strand:+ start:13557 stop:14366 length:810 start_codon:yes stop_codon:yes gene_type:complete
MKRKISISTLAFNGYKIDHIIKILKKNNIKNIDLAPLTIFKNWKTFFKQVYFLKKKLRKNRININAIQGIFFNLETKLFFSNNRELNKLFKHLNKIILVCKKLNIKKIIIGSSYLRNKKDITKQDADTKFVEFFSRFKKILKKNKIFFCIETIPKKYKEDYLYNFDHTIKVIKMINCKYILINFDTSIFHFNKYKFGNYSNNFKYIKNTQISSKNFKSFVYISKNNKKFSKSLKKFNKLNSISLEMILNRPSDLLVEKSIDNFKKHFSN